MTKYVLQFYIIYTQLHFMVFLCFQRLFIVSVCNAIQSPSDCCWSSDNTSNVWCWDKTFIRNRWPAESFPRSMWVKKFNLQITFMYIHFSHYDNPPKCIIDTADIWKALDVFISISLIIDLSKSNWRNSLSPPCSRHGLWLCKAILQVSTKIDHFFLTYTKKCDGRNFSYT